MLYEHSINSLTFLWDSIIILRSGRVKFDLLLSKVGCNLKKIINAN